MKKILAVLVLLLCLLPAAALAEIKVNGVLKEAASGVITIDTNDATVTGSVKDARLVVASNVTNVTFDNVQVTAPQVSDAAAECAALTIMGDNVTLTFIGKNNMFVGGENTAGEGGDGIYASGALTIKGSVTARGGEGKDGGDGIKANILTLEGVVSAEGGYGSEDEGGEGIETDDDEGLFIQPTAVVTVIGGAGSGVGGHGIDSQMVMISSGAMLSVVSGGGDKPAIDGEFNGVGYESNDGVNWVPTNKSTMRYFTTCPPMENMPQTGDASMLMSWMALLGASAVGLKLRRKN